MITVTSVPSFRFLVLSPQAPAAVVGERWPPLVGNAVLGNKDVDFGAENAVASLWGLDTVRESS